MSGEWWIAGVRFSIISFALRTSLFLAMLTAGSAASAQVRMAEIAAHPALWTVHSKTSTVYILGSLHLLPPNVNWHTPEIDRAMDSADTFYFEAPLDDESKAGMAEFVREHGSLPQGTSLRSLLDKHTLADHERALSKAQLPEATLDGERPWLAALILDVAYLQRMHYVAEGGVDQQIWAYAKAHGKTLKAFETLEQQLLLFMPTNQKLELAEFDVEINALQSEQEMIGAMVDAWSKGDARAVGTMVNKELEKSPETKKVLIVGRNNSWMKTFDAMLAGTGTYFVTVGTGHLVGSYGVPALLRKRGYAVEGP